MNHFYQARESLRDEYEVGVVLLDRLGVYSATVDLAIPMVAGRYLVSGKFRGREHSVKSSVTFVRGGRTLDYYIRTVDTAPFRSPTVSRNLSKFTTLTALDGTTDTLYVALRGRYDFDSNLGLIEATDGDGYQSILTADGSAPQDFSEAVLTHGLDKLEANFKADRQIN